MSILSKLLGVWAMEKTLSTTTPLLMRLALGMAAITLLSMMATFLFAIVVAVLTWYSYLLMLAHGIAQTDALLVILLTLLTLLVVVGCYIRSCWLKTTLVIRKLIHRQMPLRGRVSALSDAFMHGYQRPHAR